MKDYYGRVYDILVSIGGASESMRAGFIQNLTGEHPCDEWRFSGHLGFGGKYWTQSNDVNCYAEDVNPERLEIIHKLNDALAALEVVQK